MKTKVTIHAAQRVKEREGTRISSDIKALSERARQKGYVKTDYEGEFRRFLDRNFHTRFKSEKIKVYKGLVWIFCGNKSRTLKTVINIPEHMISLSEQPQRI